MQSDAEKIRAWLYENYSISKCVAKPGSATLACICEKLLDVVEMAAKCRCGFVDGMTNACCACALLLPRKALADCIKELDA